MGRRQILDRLPKIVPAVLAAAWCFVAVDAWRRGSPHAWLLSRHFLAALALYAVVASALGLAAWCVVGVQGLVSARLARRWPRLARWSGPLYYGLIAALAIRHTAVWTFRGPRARAYAHVGPVAFVAVTALAAMLVAAAATASERALSNGRWRLPAISAVVAAGVAASLIYGDLHFFVALYLPLHTALEVSAGVLIALVVAVALGRLARNRRARAALRWVTVGGLTWVAVWFAARPVRASVQRQLAEAWLEPIYVGRMMRRLDIAAAMVTHPAAWREQDSTAARLRQHFQILSVSRDPVWNKPLVEPPDVQRALQGLRGPQRDYNILVYYVDTLRNDVARDPRTMPAVVAFARQSLDFRSAYSSGSDTLHALPGITGGSYDIDAHRSSDLIQVARRAGMKTAIAIPESAHEFLGKLRPDFRFDETFAVQDFPQNRTDVWGYGADRSTAAPLVDETLSWLRDHKNERFLFWVFNFDQHNWRELNTEYVHGVANRLKVPDAGEQNWRYRVVAAGVDSQFKRLLQGLGRLGLADKTIVVFIADHGEALGREGFWVHSVFLWESLIRVPLVIRVPHLKPARIAGRVSLVDVAPTLVRYIQNDPDMSGYQGEDLLTNLIPKRPPRRLPLLMSGVSQEQLVRIGMIEPQEPWKLVLSLETATPELYDLQAPDPDAHSVADEHQPVTLQMLRALVRSPLFPRKAGPPQP